MFSLQLEIFLLILVGFVLSKLGYFSAHTRKQLTNIVLWIVLPCATIQSFEIEVDQDLLVSMALIFLISIGIQGIHWIFCATCWNQIHDDRKISLQYGTMVSNAGFMGMPVTQSAFGATGLLYASIFLIPQRICMWSYGLSLYTDGQDRKEVIRKVMTNPCIVAIYIGVVVMVLGMFDLHLPDFLDSTIAAIGNCNTALSMIVIGGILSDVPKDQIGDKLSLLYSGLRLLVIPMILFLILIFLPVDPMVRNVCVLLSAMPAASTTAMLAQRYEKDPEFASKIIFVSTLFSMITLPIIFLLLERF
ncbi:AEC family transporter [uncultured Faecalicoccus sp.]|uniref:AEC family transporter n=1 Tax=uncultured Faecalicoccus sp. TaxID=1971760 RepID=UPI0025E58F2F|nr:AEC family transporter [uncultured Faecalicoccus sp.]